MFDTILIANRGEIACRVIRTARRLGIRTIAVYSEADAHALHVELADAAVCIGPAPARESYLDMEAILAAARTHGADAVHPGYGFLAENAGFAHACAAAGIVFVGPPPAAIRAMGSKIDAKRLMESSGVPLLPGYHGEAQDDQTLRAAADGIGYPLLIKASAGGGGKGMRIVHDARELQSQLDGARREARKAFGDDRVLLERYLERSRHIEIQVFADSHGGCIHLHERDCSIQRRHQKIVEEAPAPGLPAAQRAAMGEAAIRAARRVGYVGAGTVEFIVAGSEFWFMEMNTRLQVEHPVTEMITGTDLVEWQLRIAAGERLPLTQDQVPLRGHAIEARIYAEDPDRDFLPATGLLWHLEWPERGNGLRIDAGVRAGDEVTVHYDPMLAKLIAWSETRAGAVTLLHRALARCEIAGVTSNVGLLHAISGQEEFAAGNVHTGFVAEHAQLLLAGSRPQEGQRVAAIAAWMSWALEASLEKAHSPWGSADGWRLNASSAISVELREEFSRRRVHRMRIEPVKRGARVHLDGSALDVEGLEFAPGSAGVRVGAEILRVGWQERDDRLHLFLEGRHYPFAVAGHEGNGDESVDTASLKSPMPGQVIQVLVTPGAAVRRGQPLMIVEAMKMEHTVLAPHDGIVESIGFVTGDRVEEGVQLLRLKSPPSVEEG